MKSQTRQRIRPISRETRFQRVRGLKCYKEVHQRLLEGWATSRVAKFVQEERKECLDITLASLDTQLNEYRASIPKGEVVHQNLPRFVQEAAEKVAEDFDSLVEMRKLYKLQMKRIDIDLKKEEQISKLFPSMTQEMRAAREILSDISELEMNLGLNTRHLGKMDVEARLVTDVAQNYDAAVGKAVENPESRRKLLGIAERFMALASGRTGEVADAVTEPEEAMAPDLPSVPEEKGP